MKRKISFLTLTVIFVTTIGIFISSCKKDDVTPIQATSLALVSGSGQSGIIETTLANSVELIVKDQNGDPFAGTTVKFAVAEGSVSSASGTTDTDGKVSVNWTLGATLGTQTLIVTAFQTDGTTALSGSPLSVTATASNIPAFAESIELVSGANQTAPVSTSLADAIEIIVKDQYGNGFAGATVKFNVPNGSVSAAEVVSDASGKASVTWTLGGDAGTQTLSVTAFESDGTTALTNSPLEVTATGAVAKSIELSSGGNQTAPILTSLADVVEVIVKDQFGNAFAGATVYFEVAEGSLSVASTVTDATGIASVTWTLGVTPGTQSLTVTAFEDDGITPLTNSPLDVTAKAATATSIELVSASSLKGALGTTLADAVEVLVKDQYGNAFAGATVDFAVADGSVTAAAVTDANGNTSVIWTLGSASAPQILTITAASLTGSPIEVKATIVISDVDGNEYGIVKIGTQFWMAENLKVTHYDNAGAQGTPIPNEPNDPTVSGEFSDAEWALLGDDDIDKAYCWYGNDVANKDIYGALYTYAAATNGDNSGVGVQGICPTGWHLPSDAEWATLTGFLGTSAGGKMKTTGDLDTGDGLWTASTGSGATNESGFSALPGSYRYNGSFAIIGDDAYFWSSTQFIDIDNNYTRAGYLSLTYTTPNEASGDINKNSGFSVRCVKD